MDFAGRAVGGGCVWSAIFMPNAIADALIESRQMPPPPWPYTDDTEMALSIVSTLRDYDGIDPDELAQSFALRYDPRREYGPAMHRLLPWIAAGGDWEEGAREFVQRARLVWKWRGNAGRPAGCVFRR